MSIVPDLPLCTKCKVRPRHKSHRSWCGSCLNEYNQAWRKRNKDRYLPQSAKSQRERYHRDIEKTRKLHREYARIWRERNREHLRAYDRERYPIRVARGTTPRYYRKYPKGFRNVRSVEYKREIRAAYSQNYRAKVRENGGSFTDEQWDALKTEYGNRCLCCGKVEGEVKITIDHVIPVSKGGPNTLDNLQPLCETCNKSKGDKTIDYRTMMV